MVSWPYPPISVLISQDANSIGNDVDCQMMIGLSQRWASKPYGRSSKAVWAIGRTPALGNAPKQPKDDVM